MIIQVQFADTGGNCRTYWGLLEDGRYFVYFLDAFEFLDADFGITLTRPFFDKTGGDITEWENEHRTAIYFESDGYPDEVKEIIKAMCQPCMDKILGKY